MEAWAGTPRRGRLFGLSLLFLTSKRSEAILELFRFFRVLIAQAKKNWADIFKPLWSPGINVKASIPPAYVAWAGIFKKYGA